MISHIQKRKISRSEQDLERNSPDKIDSIKGEKAKVETKVVTLEINKAIAMNQRIKSIQ